MRKILVQTFVSIDGVMQAPGGPDEDTSNGFDLGGWSMGYWDESMGEVMAGLMKTQPDILLGRVTYDIFAGYWPTPKGQEADSQMADQLNKAKKFVVSHDDLKLEWENSELITGDVVEKLQALKKSNGPDLWVAGSSNLIQTLLKHSLVDEFFLWIFPVVLGKGKRLFGEGAKADGLKLTWSKVSPSGVFMGRYEPGQKIKFGTPGG